jgi:hypothetical protein
VARNSKTKTVLPTSVEGLIAQSLDQIAAILIRAGVDLAAAERMLRRAFINAAYRAITASNTKSTQSQIASIAGVSRLDVRRLLDAKPGEKVTRGSSPPTRIQSVINGWRTDPAFHDKRGRARPLTKSDFQRLVRKFGRDVTPKALRLHLLRLELASEKDGVLHLHRQSKTQRPTAAHADLRFIASQLASIDFELGRRAYSTKRVSIYAPDNRTIRAIRQIALTRFETVLSSLASMSTRGINKAEKGASQRLLVSSTIAIETEDGK